MKELLSLLAGGVATPTPAQKSFSPDDQILIERLRNMGAELVPGQPSVAGLLGADQLTNMMNNVSNRTGQTARGFDAQPLLDMLAGGSPSPVVPQAPAPALVSDINPGMVNLAQQDLMGKISDITTPKTLDDFLGAMQTQVGTDGQPRDIHYGSPLSNQQPVTAAKAQPVIAPAEEVIPQASPVETASPVDIAGALEGVASPEDIAGILEGTATPEKEEEVQASFFDNPDIQKLMLGVGIGLLQGKDAGTAIAMGHQMMSQAQQGRAAGKRQAALDEAEVGLKDAQAKKALADATKTAKDAGLTGDTLKGFRATHKTLVGEGGDIGDEVGSQRLNARAANTELAGDPNNVALKKIRDDSVKGILTYIDGLDEDEAAEEVAKLRADFGDEYIQEMINNF